MAPHQIPGLLRSRRRATALVLCAAVAAAVLVGNRVSLAPLGLESRATTTGTATAQVLVDASASTLANLRQDTLPLTTRAGVFAQYMASAAIRDTVARAVGLPPAAVTTEGPFSGPGQQYNVVAPATARNAQLADEGSRYRLQFVAQPDLPLVTIYAQGPDAARAAALADAVIGAVRADLTRLRGTAPPDLRPQRRVVVRSLGPAQSGTVTAGGGAPMTALAFVLTLAAGLWIVAALEAARRHREDPAALDGELFGDVDDRGDGIAPASWRTLETQDDPEPRRGRVRLGR